MATWYDQFTYTSDYKYCPYCGKMYVSNTLHACSFDSNGTWKWTWPDKVVMTEEPKEEVKDVLHDLVSEVVDDLVEQLRDIIESEVKRKLKEALNLYEKDE